MNFTNISLLLKGYAIRKAQKKIHEIKNMTLSEFDSYLVFQKEFIVNYHIRYNPFYKDLIKQENWTWDNLPVLKKKDIQVDLKNRIPTTIKSYYVNKTSGSTGNPFYFAKDKFCHALTWANIQSCFSEHGVYGKKQARFYGMPKNKLAYYTNRVKDFFLNRYRFNVFDLSDVAFEKWILNFSKNNYVFLNGYTSVLVLFAKYLKSKDLVLTEVCPSLKKCMVTSEMCFEEDKRLMQKYFGVSIINEYGASELDLIAFENKKGEWLINTRTLFVEILDEENLPVPEGEIGRIIITSLYNKANPFIRYDIGDIGSIQRINSKKIILKKLEGRNDDLVKLPNGKKAIGLTFYYVTKSIMEKTSEIKEIKINQIALTTFELNYISKEPLSIPQEKQIIKAMTDYLECDVEVIFKKRDSLHRGKSGKLKQFTSFQ